MSAASEPRHPPWTRLVMMVVAVELGLSRITARPQLLSHIAFDVVGFAVLAGLLAWLQRRAARAREAWPPGLSLGVSVCLVGGAAVAMLAPGFYYSFRNYHALDSGAALASAAGAGVVAGAITGVGQGALGPRLTPLAGALGLLLAAVVYWLAVAGGLPSWPTLLAALAWTLAVGGLAVTRAVALAPLLASALALSPVRVLPEEPLPWGARAPAADGPDVVLIVADTLRADDAQKLTALRTVAERGRDFGAIQAASTWTLPCMASLLTSRPVEEHAARRTADKQSRAIRADVETLAEVFAKGGYATAAVIGNNPNVGPKFGFARGFDVFDLNGAIFDRFDVPGGRGGARPMLSQLTMTLLGHVAVPPLMRLLETGERDAGHVVGERVRHVLERRPAGRPLFLWAHFMDVHTPYTHIFETVVPTERAIELERGLIHEQALADPYWATPEGTAALRAGYLNELRHLDRYLNDLLASLGPPPARGRVLALTADHGEEFFEHGSFEHGHAFFQEIIAVPLVIEGPALAAPDGLVSSLDIAPTLLQAAGLAVPPGMRGKSLLAPVGQRTLYARTLHYADDPADYEGAYAARARNWKLIEHAGTALYDLSTDPHEQRDLAERRPEQVQALRATQKAVRTGGAVQLDESEIEALKALGYSE